MTTELVAVLDVRAEPATQHWAEALRTRLADPGIAMVGARALVQLAGNKKQFSVQGPIIIGADTRLGAGHLADDPGPGGWLMVDQEASAIAPPALLARTAALAACTMPELAGDALWIDLCAQMRAAGSRLAWTPDVSFITPDAAIKPDTEYAFRQGGPAARALPWADPYHHPALSLQRQSAGHRTAFRSGARRPLGPSEPAGQRRAGDRCPGAERGPCVAPLRPLEADWAPEPMTAAELGRRAPASGCASTRKPPPPCTAPLIVPCTARRRGKRPNPPSPGPTRVFGTSPGLVKQLRALARPGQSVSLWRPALSSGIWQDFQGVNGLNTKPRVLWVDEGNAPGWFTDFVNATQDIAAWIVVERKGGTYSGAVARLSLPVNEVDWARALAELTPQILVRPADLDASADHTISLDGRRRRVPFAGRYTARPAVQPARGAFGQPAGCLAAGAANRDPRPDRDARARQARARRRTGAAHDRSRAAALGRLRG